MCRLSGVCGIFSARVPKFELESCYPCPCLYASLSIVLQILRNCVKNPSESSLFQAEVALPLTSHCSPKCCQTDEEALQSGFLTVLSRLNCATRRLTLYSIEFECPAAVPRTIKMGGAYHAFVCREASRGESKT